MTEDIVLIDVETSSLTLAEVMGRISQLRQDPQYVDYEIFLDGDRNAIVARLKP